MEHTEELEDVKCVVYSCKLLSIGGHLNFALPRTSELSFDKCCRGSMLMSICGSLGMSRL